VRHSYNNGDLWGPPNLLAGEAIVIMFSQSCESLVLYATALECLLWYGQGRIAQGATTSTCTLGRGATKSTTSAFIEEAIIACIDF
jgi:hypothetical protein